MKVILVVKSDLAFIMEIQPAVAVSLNWASIVLVK